MEVPVHAPAGPDPAPVLRSGRSTEQRGNRRLSGAVAFGTEAWRSREGTPGKQRKVWGVRAAQNQKPLSEKRKGCLASSEVLQRVGGQVEKPASLKLCCPDKEATGRARAQLRPERRSPAQSGSTF